MWESNSRNDVPRWNHGRTHPAPCVRPRHVCSVFACICTVFAGLIRQTPLPTFSDTAITDRYSDITIFQLRVHWVRISWSIGSEKSFRQGVEPSTSCVNGEHPIHQTRRSAVQLRYNIISKKKKKKRIRRTFTEYSVIIISLAVLQMKVVGGRKMGITQCILKKKK